MIKIVFLSILVCYSISLVDGHGMLTDPPGRPFRQANSFQYSGGFVAQFYYRGGDNHVCGASGFDAWPWPNSTQMTGPIQRTYISGSTVTMRTYFLAAHGGYLRIKLCKLKSPSDIVSQDCLDQNVLKVQSIDYPTNYQGQNATNYDDGTVLLPYLHNTNMQPGSSKDSLTVYANFSVKLPPGLTCENCVVLFDYRQTGPFRSWSKFVNNLTVPTNTTGIEGYNDVVYPHQSFRTCSDIKIVSDPNNPSAVYVPNSVKPANTYPLIFSCNNFGYEYNRSTGMSNSPKTSPRQIPDKYKSNPAGLYCTIFKEDKISCDICRQNCMTNGKVCPSSCYCTWFPRKLGTYQIPIQPGKWDVQNLS